MGWKGEPFPGLSLELTGVAPTILRHEGRLPLSPYVCRDMCWKSKVVSGTHCPDVILSTRVLTATPGSNPLRRKSRVVSGACIWTGRAKPFPGGVTAHKFHLPATQETHTHTHLEKGLGSRKERGVREGHNKQTQRNTLRGPGHHIALAFL